MNTYQTSSEVAKIFRTLKVTNMIGRLTASTVEIKLIGQSPIVMHYSCENDSGFETFHFDTNKILSLEYQIHIPVDILTGLLPGG